MLGCKEIFLLILNGTDRIGFLLGSYLIQCRYLVDSVRVRPEDK